MQEVHKTNKKHKELSVQSSHTPLLVVANLSMLRHCIYMGIQCLWRISGKYCRECEILQLYGNLGLQRKSNHSTQFQHIFLHKCYRPDYKLLGQMGTAVLLSIT